MLLQPFTGDVINLFCFNNSNLFKQISIFWQRFFLITTTIIRLEVVSYVTPENLHSSKKTLKGKLGQSVVPQPNSHYCIQKGKVYIQYYDCLSTKSFACKINHWHSELHNLILEQSTSTLDKTLLTTQQLCFCSLKKCEVSL